MKSTMAQNPPSNLRIMVDANVLVAGLGWPRFPYEVLQHAIDGDYQLVLSDYVIDEAREHFGRLFPSLTPQLDAFLEASNYEAVPSPAQAQIAANPGLARDIKDIPVVLSAKNARVDYLVSLDKDLTSPDEPVHQHLKVLLPGTFLREQMGWTSEELEAIRSRTWQDMKCEDE